MQKGNFKTLLHYGLKDPLHPHAIIRNNRELVNMPKKKVQKAIDIPTGEYTGVIEKNEIRESTQGYEYHETYIKVDVKDSPVLRLGVPFAISKKSALGKILIKFGAELKDDEEVDTDSFLKKDMKVKFSIVNKEGTGKSEGVKFSNIIADTLEPSDK